VFDINDSYTLTETVNRTTAEALDGEDYVGPQIAPLVPVRDRKLKRGWTQVAGVGMANIKAPHATPTIFIPQIQFGEEFISLVDMDEMSPITEDEWEKLTGENEFEKMRVGADIIQRQRFLQLRYEVRTEWMRWQAFSGVLRAEVADSAGQQVDIKYGIPVSNFFTASPSWSNRLAATPITNIRAGQRGLFQKTRKWGTEIYMGPDTFENVQYSKEVADLLNANTNGGQKLPSFATIESLLYGGVNSNERPRPGMTPPTIHVTAAGWTPYGSYTRGTGDLQYFLPEGKVLIMPQSPQVQGERVADMADGRVLMRPTPTAEPNWRPGPATETLISTMPPYTQYVRQACVRVPRINVPEAFYWLTV
jgi:hypothetical protein